MKRFLPYLLLSVFCTSACSKKQDIPISQPITTGTLSGTMMPAGAVTGIVLNRVGVSEKTYPVKLSLASGAFSAADLPVGNYVLNFKTDGHYNPVPGMNAAVNAGENRDLGVITTTEINFSLSYNINGTFEGWHFKGFHDSASFYIGPQSIGSYPEDTRTVYVPTIRVDNITGPGTYKFQGQSKSYITYEGFRLGSGTRISSQSSANTGGEGTVVITLIDPGTRMIKGTFSAILTPASGNTADTKVITNGVINANY